MISSHQLIEPLSQERLEELKKDPNYKRALVRIKNEDYDSIYHEVRGYLRDITHTVHFENEDLIDISKYRGFDPNLDLRKVSVLNSHIEDVEVRCVDIMVKWILFIIQHRSASRIVEDIELSRSGRDSYYCIIGEDDCDELEDYSFLYYIAKLFIKHYTVACNKDGRLRATSNDVMSLLVVRTMSSNAAKHRSSIDNDEIDTILLPMLYGKGFGTYLCITYCQRIRCTDKSFIEFNDVFTSAIMRMTHCPVSLNDNHISQHLYYVPNSRNECRDHLLFRGMVIVESFGNDYGFMTSQVYSSFSTIYETSMSFTKNSNPLEEGQYACLLVLPCWCIGVKRLADYIPHKSHEEHLVYTDNIPFKYAYKCVDEKTNIHCRIIVPSFDNCECSREGSVCVQYAVEVVKKLGYNKEE